MTRELSTAAERWKSEVNRMEGICLIVLLQRTGLSKSEIAIYYFLLLL